MKNKQIYFILTLLLLNIGIHTNLLRSQQVEVLGELKVSQMIADENEDNLVIRKNDGTLGTRSVALLPPPPAPIDSMRNLASDYELAKHLCECPNLPPFLIQNLLESGYTEEDLLNAGVPYINITNAQFTCGDTLVDNRNGQMYTTIRIGGQCWMAENLNIGSMIDASNNQQNNSSIEKYCIDNDPAYCTTYGGLYQWDEMMQYVTDEGKQGICPSGWHLPSDNEVKTLEMHLGMTQAEVDVTGWRGTTQASQIAGNESLWTDGVLDQHADFGTSGFTLLPGGYRSPFGIISSHSLLGYFWSSTELGSGAWARHIRYNNLQVYHSPYEKNYGFGVRCVQD